MKQIIINRIPSVILWYVICCLTGKSFNPNNWNDLTNLISIALEIGFFLELFQAINQYDKNKRKL